MRTDRPPGPRGLPFVGSLLGFARDPLAFVRDVHERHGDIAVVDVAGLSFYQLGDPAHIDIVLRQQHKDFVKGALGAEKRMLFGQGLATSDGELWRIQRQLAQPAFHHQQIAGYADVVTAFAREAVDELVTKRRVVNLHTHMMQLTLRVVGKVLFGTDVTNEARAVGAALEDLMRFFTRQSSLFLRLVPRPLRRIGSRDFHRAVARLDQIIAEIIEQRRRDASPAGVIWTPRDLLGMLMAARDVDGAPMSDRQLRDEVMTAFLAGHETTGLALSWTLALIALHPEIEQRLVAELDRVLSGRAPTLDDLRQLPLLSATLRESMRLYPPAWILARQATRNVEIGGFTIPEGAFVVMSQWVVHRDPRWFSAPEQFIPDRWLGDLEARIPRFAYFPFGGGPRGCIGNALATMEATIVLATFLQRARFVSDPARPARPEASISLRPRGGLWGHVTRRAS